MTRAQHMTATPTSIRQAGTAPLALTAAKDGPRIDSRLFAESMGNTHRPTVALIDKYRETLERFGQVLFKKAVGERKQGGGKAERVAALAMAGATDCHQGYARAKAALGTLQGLLAPPDKQPAIASGMGDPGGKRLALRGGRDGQRS